MPYRYRLSMKSRVVAAALVLALILAGWLLWQTRQKPERAEAESVSVCFSSRAGFLVAVAQAEGYFREVGLEVRLIPFDVGRLALKGMLTGTCDLATPAETPVVFASLDGEPFKIVASLDSSSSRGKVVARRDHGIERASDLAGKRIATPKGTTGHFFAHMLLLSNGIAPNEAALVFNSDISAMLQALERGQVDAVSLWEPYVSQAQAMLGSQGVLLVAPGAIHSASLLTASDRFISERSGTLRKVLQALLRAEAKVADSPSEAAASVARLLGTTKSEVSVVFQDTEFNVELPQSLLAILEDQARWAIGEGLTEVNDAPNYLRWIYFDALLAVDPEAVTILR